jgi:hypothetical protein
MNQIRQARQFMHIHFSLNKSELLNFIEYANKNTILRQSVYIINKPSDEFQTI